MGAKLCSVCHKRIGCVSPCANLLNELEKFGKQYSVELTVGSPEYTDDPDFWGAVSRNACKLTDRERAIATLDMMRFSRDYIAKLFKIQRSTLRRYVYGIRRKLRE
jgi:hypothetical protein